MIVKLVTISVYSLVMYFVLKKSRSFILRIFVFNSIKILELCVPKNAQQEKISKYYAVKPFIILSEKMNLAKSVSVHVIQPFVLCNTAIGST